MKDSIREENGEILSRLADFLNHTPHFITEDIMRELTSECSLSAEEAYAIVLAAAIGLRVDESPRDRHLFHAYFPQMVRQLDVREYTHDPYFLSVSIPSGKLGAWEFRTERYRPYEAFVCDDLLVTEEGRAIPQIGFFDTEYRYPAVLEGGREWMLITPNEINTMREPIAAACGNVLTFGLGLGYYAFMTSRKHVVERVTVVERDADVIRLFYEHILPQCEQREKIKIVEADALDYAAHRMGDGRFDHVFCDIWHDPSDGIPLYLAMKKHEEHAPRAEFRYWIEKTMRYYMDAMH